MLENDDRGAGEIELGDGGGDRKGFELVGSLGHDDGIEASGGFFFVVRRLDDIVGDLAPPGAGAPA